MSTDPGPSGTSAAGETLEVAHFTPEQLVLIDRLIAARVASPSTPEDGSGAGPSATSSSASIGECLPPNAHALGAGHAPWAGTGLPLPRGTPGGSHAGTGRCPHEHTRGHVAPCLPSAGADLLCLLAGSAASLPLFTMPSAGTGTTPGSSAGPVWPSVVSSPASTPPGAPVALGELPGFGSVPPRLIKKILAKEYVDIWELLPETWQVETEGSCCHSKRPRRSLVTDINVWTECFATMAAILAAAFPAKAPHLFAYLRTITKASRTFECSAWASYDMAFRRQAANRGSLDWGHVDAALYNEAIAGRAKQIPRCRYCLADTHTSRECLHAPVDATAAPTLTESRSVRPGRLSGAAGRAGSAVDICRLFNSPGGSRCRFVQCRYAHLCTGCRRPHPLAECGEKRPQTPSGAAGGGHGGTPPHSTA